jgi:arginase
MTQDGTTLRLNMPQWQGGNEPAYGFGARLLSFLAPESKGPTETIDIATPTDIPLPVEQGVVARSALLEQARAARKAINRHQPARIVTLGGDCLVGLAPVAYLRERYGEQLGMLWIDAHPDVMIPDEFSHAHAHVLGMLLHRKGADPGFVAEIREPLDARHVIYAGMDECAAHEEKFISEMGLSRISSAALQGNSDPIVNWIQQNGIRHLAVHFDLDVLDPRKFGPLLFNRPESAEAFKGVPKGKMTTDQIVRLLADVERTCDIVGLTITEHLPWETMQTARMLARLPLLRG